MQEDPSPSFQWGGLWAGAFWKGLFGYSVGDRLQGREKRGGEEALTGTKY